MIGQYGQLGDLKFIFESLSFLPTTKLESQQGGLRWTIDPDLQTSDSYQMCPIL